MAQCHTPSKLQPSKQLCSNVGDWKVTEVGQPQVSLQAEVSYGWLGRKGDPQQPQGGFCPNACLDKGERLTFE